jgi:hypothetical protein
MRKLVADGNLKESYTFHDLKAKGVSDFDGDKQAAGGHKSASMVNTYNRKKGKISPTK